MKEGQEKEKEKERGVDLFQMCVCVCVGRPDGQVEVQWLNTSVSARCVGLLLKGVANRGQQKYNTACVSQELSSWQYMRLPLSLFISSHLSGSF